MEQILMPHNRRLNAHKRSIPKGMPAYIEGIPLTMGDISHLMRSYVNRKGEKY
jgi:hypothetical protein